ncbi:MAG: hypothetical protein DSY87_04685 [Methylococcus sp.]|nr:MAG: hypothetical protein DSY87_04685 [Methylococcus sp.]
MDFKCYLHLYLIYLKYKFVYHKFCQYFRNLNGYHFGVHIIIIDFMLTILYTVFIVLPAP